MDYFDLHCDTAYELYHKKADLYSNNLAVSIENYSGYDRKAQIFAVWCDKDKTDDECYLDFLHISSEFKEQIKKYSDHITLCTDSASLTDQEDKRLKAILSVEDARLVGNDISRLEKMYAAGVRLITLGWGGNSVICGSHDTDLRTPGWKLCASAKTSELSLTCRIFRKKASGTLPERRKSRSARRIQIPQCSAAIAETCRTLRQEPSRRRAESWA